MKTTKSTAIAVAALLSFPVLSAARAPAADRSEASGDPTWPQFATRLPGITLHGSGDRNSSLRRDPTWPDVAQVAPGIALDTYVAEQPISSIDNDGPSFALRTYARLDGQLETTAMVRR